MTTTIDLATLAPRLVEAAVAVTTGRLHLARPELTRQRLVQGDSTAAGYFRHELARSVAALLLQLDANVVAVYSEHDVPAGEELAPETPDCFAPLQLIVCVEVRTPTSEMVLRGLGQALADAAQLDALLPTGNLLEATLVTRAELRLRPRALGYRPAPMPLGLREHDASR